MENQKKTFTPLSLVIESFTARDEITRTPQNEISRRQIPSSDSMEEDIEVQERVPVGVGKRKLSQNSFDEEIDIDIRERPSLRRRIHDIGTREDKIYGEKTICSNNQFQDALNQSHILTLSTVILHRDRPNPNC